MPQERYIAILEEADTGYVASIPDLGVVAPGRTMDQALTLITTLGAEKMREYLRKRQEPPVPSKLEELAKPHDVGSFVAAVIALENPGKVVRVSISLNEGVLVDCDLAAEKSGMSRSAYITYALHETLRSELDDEVKTLITDGAWRQSFAYPFHMPEMNYGNVPFGAMHPSGYVNSFRDSMLRSSQKSGEHKQPTVAKGRKHRPEKVSAAESPSRRPQHAASRSAVRARSEP